MKNIFKSFHIIGFLILLIGCQGTSNNKDTEGLTEIIVGATVLPHAELLSVIQDDLLEQNIKLEIKEFSDYFLLNQALVDGDIDANFFQHILFLESFNLNSGNNIVSLGEVHIEPMGAYSKRISNIDRLENEAVVAIPSDPSNGARALLLLEENGLITLDGSFTADISLLNIVENPLNLQFIEIDPSQMPRILQDVDLAIINTNVALLVDLVPGEDALIIESIDSQFANVVAVRKGDETREELQALINALQSDIIRIYIEENYGGNVIPAF